MNKGKKALALFLTAVMAMSALSGCGDNGGSSAAGSSTPASSASTAAGDSNEPVTHTIGIKIDPLVEDYETNYFTQMMEEENNVNLEFFTFPSDTDGFKSKLSLMISSNNHAAGYHRHRGPGRKRSGRVRLQGHFRSHQRVP